MLGKALRQARLKSGLTQEQLAFKAGLSRNYISLLELNSKSPTIDTLFALCKAMNASPSRLIAKVEREQK